jgi:hypothetical protein
MAISFDAEMLQPKLLQKDVQNNFPKVFVLRNIFLGFFVKRKKWLEKFQHARELGKIKYAMRKSKWCGKSKFKEIQT